MTNIKKSMTENPEKSTNAKIDRRKIRNREICNYFIEQYKEGKRTEVIVNEISRRYYLSPKSLSRILRIRKLVEIAHGIAS